MPKPENDTPGKARNHSHRSNPLPTSCNHGEAIANLFGGPEREAQ